MTRKIARQVIENDYLNCSWSQGFKNDLRLISKPELPLAQAELKINGATPEFSTKTREGGLKITAQTSRFEITINNILEPKSDYIRQEIELVAKRAGIIYLDDIRFEIMLCPAEKNSRVFIPMHWAYLGSAKDMPAIDTYYHHFTIFDGYKNQIRTPAISVWGQNYGITVGLSTPLAHLRISQKINGDGVGIPCFSFSFEKPSYGPDHFVFNPYLKKGEKLRFSLFMHPHAGDWQTGMKRWMAYSMQHVVRDDFDKIPWLDDLKVIWIKWNGVTKAEIDALAGFGIKAIEVYPWTEPSRAMLDYIHSKGMKVLMEHYVLASYVIKPEEKGDKLQCSETARGRKACKIVADLHPDWCLKVLPGDESLNDIYLHMDPHVKGFRKAKVEEAVNLIKKGYDGIRYDNLLVLNGIARGAPYTTTYVEATYCMLKEIKTAIRKINPEAVILANNAGPDVFNIIDGNMYESGLSSESSLMEQAGKADWEKSNYDRAHLRMLAAKCIWEFAGKLCWVWDYPLATAPKGREKLWILRSIIFDIFHDAIIGLAVGGNLEAYKMAAELAGLARKPLGDIISKDNIVIRYFHSGIMMIMETKSKPWTGTIKIPANILPALKKPALGRISCNLFSEDKYRLKCARIHTVAPDCFKMDLDADGCAVIAIKSAEVS